jgi:hypothetical protein
MLLASLPTHEIVCNQTARRKADGEDLDLTVIGILGAMDFRDSPPRTVEAPTLAADSSFVSTGVFVTLR